MAETIWRISYDIKKVNGEPYLRPVDTFRAFEEQIPKLLQKEAENMVDRFDFTYVKIVAKDVNSDATHEFTHMSDDGFRSDWQVGRQ